MIINRRWLLYKVRSTRDHICTLSRSDSVPTVAHTKQEVQEHSFKNNQKSHRNAVRTYTSSICVLWNDECCLSQFSLWFLLIHYPLAIFLRRDKTGGNFLEWGAIQSLGKEGTDSGSGLRSNKDSSTEELDQHRCIRTAGGGCSVPLRTNILHGRKKSLLLFPVT